MMRLQLRLYLLLLTFACLLIFFMTTSYKNIIKEDDNEKHSLAFKHSSTYNVGVNTSWSKAGDKNKGGRVQLLKYDTTRHPSSDATNDEQTQTQEVRARLRHQAQFHDLVMKNAPRYQAASDATTNNTEQVYRKKRKQNKKYHYHDYSIFIVHYHKTGYVLSRELKNLIRDIEVAAKQPADPQKYVNRIVFKLSGVDDETGERIAFDQVGNWPHSAFPQRQHMGHTQCPKRFELQRGTIYVQESPDLFCSDSDILPLINSVKGGTKIIHFVRNPFDMAMSNYFYHSQEPTPEAWVHEDDPCHHLYMNGESLSSHITPTLASWTHGTSKAPGETQEQMGDSADQIVDMCQSLYQKKRSLRNATFYEHLLKLGKWNGLRLATAQMTIASGEANKRLAGGDILRMANNVVKFQNLQQSPQSNIHVLTVSMDDFIKNTKEGTMKFLDFVFGENNNVITKEMRSEAAQAQEESYNKKSKSTHVTQNEGKKSKKEALRGMLKMDKHLSHLLNLTEVLVNEALQQNG